MTSWRSENFISGGRFQNPSFSFLPRTLVLDRRVRIIVEDFQFFPPRLEGGNEHIAYQDVIPRLR